MILIIGLGNKDKKFNGTRHNIGFDLVKKFLKDLWGASLSFNKKLGVDIFIKDNLIFALPHCYMNESGRIIKKLVQYFKIPVFNLLVIHDDSDLALGEFKLQKGRGSAGHKGVESIIAQLNSKDFWRLRVGIRTQKVVNQKAVDLVLKKFSSEEKQILKSVWPKIFQQISDWVEKQKISGRGYPVNCLFILF